MKRKKKIKPKQKVKFNGEYMSIEKLKVYMEFATKLKIAQEDTKKKGFNK